jgi:hypothetical protein
VATAAQAWIEACKQAQTVNDLGGLLLDLENCMAPSAFARGWKDVRVRWLRSIPDGQQR